MALDAAKAGRRVAMVCSGDSGIYGMAGLLFELRGESQDPEISVIPGLTAACSGGAVLGAPLTHDFAVISLSDRLTSPLSSTTLPAKAGRTICAGPARSCCGSCRRTGPAAWLGTLAGPGRAGRCCPWRGSGTIRRICSALFSSVMLRPGLLPESW